MSKLRILFLITDLGKGGAERFLVDHCSQLLTYPDIEFKIGVLYDNNQYEEDTINFDIVHLNYQTFSFFKKNENLAYKKLLEEFKPDVIHSNRYLAEFLSSFYVNKRIAYVCHGHDNMVEFANFRLSCLWNKMQLLNFLEKIYLLWFKYRKVNTYFIANSKHTNEYYLNVLHHFNRKYLLRLDIGFNFTKFYQNQPKQISADGKLRILNVGSFQQKKNQNFILDIAKELQKNIPNFEIHLIGDGQLFEVVKARVIKENLEQHIFLHGVQNNVLDWYRTSDIYLHTAYYEPFGLVFLEAMAAGLPVVCLNGKGNKEIIDHGENGFIFEHPDPRLFADALSSLFHDTNLYTKMSECGKKFSQQYRLELKSEVFVSLYRKIKNSLLSV